MSAPSRAVVLVTGFGPFLQVNDNPSGRLAQVLNGRRAGGHTVVGRALPVSYGPGLARALALTRRLAPRLVIGLGVHRGDGVQVERVGYNRTGDRPDVDGVCPADLGPGPDALVTPLDVEHLARCLGASVSSDAGQYLCNAWLYTVLRDASCPGVFIHIPPGFNDDQRVVDGLSAFLTTAR